MFDKEKVSRDLLSLVSVSKTEERAALFGKIIREIRKRPLAKQGYSSKEVQAFVQHTVAFARHEEPREQADYIKRAVERLHREFRTQLGTWNFIISIENLKLKPRSLKIGDVKFFTFNSYRRKKERTRLWQLIKDNPHYDIKWKRNFVKSEDENILSRIEGKVCAHVQIGGRLGKAQLIAYDKVETAIALLKLFRPHLYDEDRQYFHVTGKVIPSTIRLTLRYSEDGENINPILERVGFLLPFEIDNKRMRSMRSAGFRKLNDMLKKEELNELETDIITSIRLFASACDTVITKSSIRRPIGLGFPPETDSRPKTTFEEISLSERLVGLFIALEALLIFDEKEPLRSNISERGAFLIVKPGKSKKETYERRKAIKDFIARMYDYRSAYVHHRRHEIDHKTLARFTLYVQEIILKVILIKDRLKLTTEAEFREYFEKKKLS